jgi:hypothetical protein
LSVIIGFVICPILIFIGISILILGKKEKWLIMDNKVIVIILLAAIIVAGSAFFIFRFCTIAH